MTSILNAAAVYCFLLVVFRFAGRRTIAEMTTFDFVLILIVSEATQGALIRNDNSFTNAALAIMTLLGFDVALSHVKQRSKSLEQWLDGTPLVVVRDGRPLQEILTKSRVDENDILAAARATRGLPNMQSIAYAVLENNGHITVIPWQSQGQSNSTQTE